MSHILDMAGIQLRAAGSLLLRAVVRKPASRLSADNLYKRRGFTLVEVMICLLIVMMAGMATIAAITYSRLNMELEKQRIAALNYCRQAMEAMQSLDTAHADFKPLVPFNAPGVEDLNANIKIEYYKFKQDASDPNNILQLGTVDWTSAVTTPLLDEPVFARVTVSWLPYGSVARPQTVCMSTVLTRGID